MLNVKTLTAALVHLKEKDTGIVFIDDDNVEEFISYPELTDMAKKYLSYMQDSGIKKGDEVILAFHSLKNFVVSYWASLFGGIIPVPLTIPKSNEEIQKVINVWTVLKNPWIIVDDELVCDKFEKRAGEEKSEVVSRILKKIVVSADCTACSTDSLPILSEVSEDDIAFIQFSSGSTGNPKGVVLTHKNLVCNAYDIIEASELTEKDSYISWKPITHDFGMIAFHLVPVIAGITQYRMTTKHFIWKATDWFSIVNKHRITVLGTTNFGIQHFMNRMDTQRAEKENWDLSCIRIIYNAAEMINPKLCSNFIQRMGQYGLSENVFKPGYGLAENTLVVSVCRASQSMNSITINRDYLGIGDKANVLDKGDENGIEYAICGPTCSHSQVKILDNNGEVLEDGYVGHIYVKGDCVTQGYYRNEEATREIIKKDHWLNTQDVGFVYQNQVVIIGREKELIIIGGVNYYPRDIEDVILQVLGLNKLNQFIACGIPNRETGTDDLDIFVYYKGLPEGFEEIQAKVKQIVRKKMGIEVSEVIPIRYVPKTTSGKVQRFKIIQEYLKKESETSKKIEKEENKTQLNHEDNKLKIVKILNEFVDLEKEDYYRSLFELGCSSMQLLNLQSRIEEYFAIKLESTFIIDHPIVNELIDELNLIIGDQNKEEEIRQKNDITYKDDIAIIGMAFRFPGGIDSENKLWEVLSQEIDVVGEIPKERWAQSKLDLSNITTLQGGFIDGVDQFDPLFFNISPKEAENIDPQQRLLLELTWKAFENAGINPQSLKGSSDVGVYVGMSSNDYLQVGRDLGHTPEAYTCTGNMFNSVAGRISYVYGFRGPCLALDTACSSSLYAIHQGANDIKHNNCTIAVAGAANLILSPEGHISFSNLHALSPSGRCRSFDNSADGYIRSEGGAVLILRKLEDAIKDKNPILGVVKGSAVNHNGHSGGLTVPSGIAQREVITKALDNAGLGINDISYIEAHGSATPIGDPQEINALNHVFGKRKDTLYVGSIKANLGHMEAAAGMAGVCKILVSMKHKQLPATLHYKEGNRFVQWDKIPISVVSQLQDWEAKGKKLRAGISSFGISGSNAHVIIENYEESNSVSVEDEMEESPYLLVLSAKSRAALWKQANEVSQWMFETKEKYSDICYSYATKRGALQYREAFLIEKPEDMKNKLSLLSKEKIGKDSLEDRGPLTFVFTGQGSQYPKMAYDLYHYSETFRFILDELDNIFNELCGFSIIKVLFECEGDELKRPLYAQTMIFSIEVALAYYWEQLGVVPDMVLGHSIGEIAATCVAKSMTLKDAAKLVAERARIMEETEQNGYMVTLLCSIEKAQELIKDYDDVSIAAVNAAENITISGAASSLDMIRKVARKARIFVENLGVSHPFHSVLMTDRAKVLYEKIKDIKFEKPQITVVSTQTGEIVKGSDIINAKYWANNLVKPVLFSKAIKTAIANGCNNYVEIGPMAILSSLIAQDYKESIVVNPSIRKGYSCIRSIRECAGELWKNGWELNWHNFYRSEGKFVLNMPNTSFDLQRIWYQDLRQNNTELKERTILSERETNKVNIRYSNQDTEIKDYLKLCLNQITGIEKERITDSLQLFSLGLDSLMLVQLGKRINEKYDVDIPIKDFFDSLHNIALLSEYIMEHRPVQEEAQNEEAVEKQVIEITHSTENNDVVYENVVNQNSNNLERLVSQQLMIMEKQLALLSGGSQNVKAVTKASVHKEEEVVVPKKKVGSYSNNIELQDEQLSDKQRQFISAFEKEYIEKTKKSKEYAEENREHLADWIASLNFNPSMKQMVYPIVSSKSQGSKFWDIDGNEYIDTAIGYGVSFFGHRPELVVNALTDQIDKGFELGPQNRVAGEVATLIHDIIGVDRVVFCNTGTEAVMVALRLARAVSGRNKIAKFITSFHGSFDGVLAEADGEGSKPMSIGIPQKMIDDTRVLTYGSMESLDVIRKHGSEMAAILVEPVQTRNPSLQPREFLHELRKICDELGIALIFDEMVTGFRIRLGGAQEYFGVKADMVLYGKLIAGGMPIGIVAGDRKYLDAVDGGVWSSKDNSKPSVPTTFFAGTFCKHPLTMAVCKEVLLFMKENGEREIERVNIFTKEFVDELNQYFEEAQVPLKMVNFGSLYKYEPLISTDMSKMTLELNLFFKLMANEGIYIWERRTCFFSLAHTKEDARKIIKSIKKCVEELRRGGFEFRRINSNQPDPEKKKSLTFLNNDTTELSNEEKRMFILSNMKGGNETYQIIGRLRFDGVPDIEKIKEAFIKIAQKHEKLRSYFEIDKQGVCQKINEEINVEFHMFDSQKQTEQEILQVMNNPFDLSKAPLWRYGIIKDSNGVYDLVISFHHIIADGTSIEIILKELSEFLKTGTLKVSESDSYSDYVKQQKDIQQSDQYKNMRSWWLGKFKTVPEALELVTDAPRKQIADFSGKHYYFEIEPSIYRRASRLIASLHTTPFVFYLSAFTVLFERISGQDDFCIGIPLDQRTKGNFEDTIGMFAQTLPLRMEMDKDRKFTDVLVQIRDLCFDAIDNSMYSYDELVQELNLKKDFSRNALFDIMFTYTNAKNREYKFGDINGITQDYATNHCPFDISLELTERDGCLFGDLNYASPLFSENRVAKLMEQFSTLIQSVLDNPEATIGTFALMNRDVVSKMIEMGKGEVSCNDTCVQGIFDKAYSSFKDDIAIRYGDREIKFGELENKVNQYACYLQHLGLKKSDLVGIITEVEPEYIIAMLAIHRIGCAWLPMDINYPASRLQYMIENSSLKAIISSKDIKSFADVDVEQILISEIEREIIEVDSLQEVEREDNDLAYVIYTSGSTGNPKGVMLSDGALANFLLGMKDALKWKENKRVACMTTPSFDIFNLETLMTLAYGGCVVLAKKQETLDPSKIAKYILENKIDYLQMTPTRLRLLNTNKEAASKVYANIEKIIIGGEQFPEDLLATLQQYKNLEIFNVYGPTETCIWSTVKDLTEEKTVNIGRPIRNTELYILDDNMNLVLEETPGNLWIGGSGVAIGYLNNEKLTSERFIKNPFGEGRIYLTGDQALWKGNEVFCLGRIDNQVKIRGYRIELQEVEQVMSSNEAVSGAAVATYDCGNGNKIIVGVYQLKEEGSISNDELKQWISSKLPDYMVPASLKEVKNIPQTQNGKIARDGVSAFFEIQSEEYVEKESDVSQELVHIWKKILGNIKIGFNETFFDLGGNSYSIILLHAELEKQYPKVFEVADLFANPTINKQAKFIYAANTKKNNVPFEKSGMHATADWFSEVMSEEGRIEAELTQEICDGIIQSKKYLNYTTTELLYSIFTLFLSKTLKTEQVTFYMVIDKKHIVPVSYDFKEDTDFVDIMEKIKQQVVKKECYVDVADAMNAVRQEGKIQILCSDSLNMDTTDLIGFFDLILNVSEVNGLFTIGMEYGSRMDEENIKKQLKYYIMFIKTVLNYLLADK